MLNGKKDLNPVLCEIVFPYPFGIDKLYQSGYSFSLKGWGDESFIRRIPQNVSGKYPDKKGEDKLVERYDVYYDIKRFLKYVNDSYKS